MHTAKKTIAKLLEKSNGGLSGSIYIPTHPDSNGQNMTADRTRFKNALQQIRLHKDYDAGKLDSTMKKLDKLYENIEFWKYQNLGLAVLFDADSFECCKLPFEVTEATYLTDHFIVSPILVMEAVDTSFYLLDINLTAPRLFYGTRGTLKQVAKDTMPGSLEDEVGKSEYKKQLQHQHGGPNVAFHGHTTDNTVDHEEAQYFKLIAEAVDEHIAGKQVPLLLAGTSNRTSSVRKELQYRFVIDEEYGGNVERLSVTRLYEASVAIVDQHFSKHRHAAVERLRETAPQFVAVGKDEIIDIAKSERGGRIDSLYLPIYRLTRDSVRPGDNTSVVIELPEDIEQIESTVTTVVKHSGEIIPVEIEAHDFLDQPKALCRY